jgi:3-oxoacyl-[acyl-carrier protein] reductase
MADHEAESSGTGNPSPISGAVLVTGASGGIGRALCLAFARTGWSIGVHYREHLAAAEATLQAIMSVGSAGRLYQADIRHAESVQRMTDDFSACAVGPLAFICNAGLGASRLLMREQEDSWADVIATNLTGAFHCLRAMAPALLARGGGSIIVIGSHAGFHGGIGQAAYAASKAGLAGLVKTAAREWGPENIRVNLILPGWQRTGLGENAWPESDGWMDHALKRPPSLDEVAGTVLHLAQLQDVSGQVWNCDSRDL